MPPAGTAQTMYLGPGGTMSTTAPAEADAFDEYLSDPAHPVPYVGHVQMGMQADYMTEDQRFATTRSDVLVYATRPLVDRNPQVFTDTPRARPEDFRVATQRVYRSKARASAITLPVERR